MSIKAERVLLLAGKNKYDRFNGNSGDVFIIRHKRRTGYRPWGSNLCFMFDPTNSDERQIAFKLAQKGVPKEYRLHIKLSEIMQSNYM